jgi:hypothetical protein
LSPIGVARLVNVADVRRYGIRGTRTLPERLTQTEHDDERRLNSREEVIDLPGNVQENL